MDNIDYMNYDHLHICNLYAGDWNGKYRFKYYSKNSKFKDKNDIINFKNSNYLFNDLNPFFNLHNIEEKYLCKPNRKYENAEITVNHLIHYQLLGLNNNVRMDFFNYSRDFKKEIEIKDLLLNKFNISENEKYNIVYNPIGADNASFHIDNDFKIINIHNIVDFQGWLFLLIENAETIHLTEGSTTNFIYHSQYKEIINLNNKRIFIHIWLRNREWFNLKMDYAWKMYDNPKLDNWEFIFSENILQKITDC